MPNEGFTLFDFCISSKIIYFLIWNNKQQNGFQNEVPKYDELIVSQ
jgi:hypothetical protein